MSILVLVNTSLTKKRMMSTEIELKQQRSPKTTAKFAKSLPHACIPTSHTAAERMESRPAANITQPLLDVAQSAYKEHQRVHAELSTGGTPLIFVERHGLSSMSGGNALSRASDAGEK